MTNNNWMRSISKTYKELKEMAPPQAPMMPQGMPQTQAYHFPFRKQTSGMPLGGQPKPDLAPPQSWWLVLLDLRFLEQYFPVVLGLLLEY